jgi:hypothetical protein
VDHVLGRHRQPHRLADRDVELVHLAVAIRVLDLPHPLLAGDVDVERVGGRAGDLEVEARAPDEHHHDEAERDHGPDDLERLGLLDVLRDLVRRAAPVLDGEVDDERPDQDREERGDRDQEAVEGVDVPRVRGRLRREERH